MASELSDLEVKAYSNVIHMEHDLDDLIEGFKLFRVRDAADGAANDDGALGGLSAVIDEGIPPEAVPLILCLAVRRIVDMGASDVRQ